MKVTTQRRRTTLAAGLALALAVAACGSDGDGAATSTTASVATTAGATTTVGTGSTPATGETRTITHKFGSTEVPVDPQRIVSVGYEEQDMILHFGKVPVLQREYFGEQPYAVWPWNQAALGDAEPETFTDEMPYELIASKQPDLIMAANAGLDQAAYERLSAIAPTVAQNGDYPDWETPYDVSFIDTGRVFGMEAEAQEMIDEMNASIDAIAAAHPEWADIVAGSVTFQENTITVDGITHSRGKFLEKLGFALPGDEIGPKNERGFIDLSMEEIDRLDGLDVLIWVNGDDDPTPIVDLPLRTRLQAHAEGREVYLGLLDTAALTAQTPRSMEYLLDRLVPWLVAAADGDPATPVQSSVDAGIAP